MLFNLLAAAADAGSSAGTTEGNKTSSPIMTVFLILLVVAVVGLFIWQSISGKKKQKEAQERVNKLKKGDRVKTIGGVCGFVHEINDAENTLPSGLRRQLQQIPKLTEIQSESKQASGLITMKFEYGTSLDYAFIEVNQKVDACVNNFPK